MSNQENEFVRMGIPDPDEVITKFIGKDGLECEEYSSFAKKSLTTSGTSQYFVRVGRGELIDPYGIDDNLSRKRISDVFKFKKVNKKAFDAFVKYLNSKDKIHFTTARRILLSER